MCPRICLAIAILFSIHVVAQTGAAKPMAEIDLKPLGVSVPTQGSVSATAMELLFLSDSRLVVLKENNRIGRPLDAHLTLYEIRKGDLRQKTAVNLGTGVMPISSGDPQQQKVLEWIDPDHFSYRAYLGKADRWLCDSELKCRDTKEGPTSMTSPHAGDCSSNNLLGFIDAGRAVCLVPGAHAKWSAIVVDPGGHHLYEVQKLALPWDTKLVTSIHGQRFGLDWKSNTRLQLLNPLACIDECPPAGRQQFVVFSSRDGKILQSFDWDPRPFNLYVLPALSPSGKTAAFVRADKLAIYDLDSEL